MKKQYSPLRSTARAPALVLEIPAKVKARIESATPSPVVHLGGDEIIPISDWPDYRAAHAEIAFTGYFDSQGRPIFTFAALPAVAAA